MPGASSRHLAAVLFADVAGYTALMQRDEQAALDTLARFKETLETKTAEFQGQIIQYYGDGCLIVFDSPLNAVNCAMAMQDAFREVVPVRIGIHLGDVIFKEGNAFGDSVNIASRVESLGVPGAILLSQTVRNQIKNHPEFQLASLGIFDFKNVDEPMEVFVLANEGFPVPRREQMEGKLKTPAPGNAKQSVSWKKWAWAAGVFLLGITGFVIFKKTANAADPERPKSIAVLPFKNLSAEQDNQFFCDGVMEAVLNHLSKIEGMTVISRTSMERYRDSRQNIAGIAQELNVAHILEGSVQRQGGKVRISVQLVAPENSRQLWSEMYDRELTDIFNIQSEIAESIAGQLKIKLSPETKSRLVSAPTDNLAAYDAYLRGREHLVKYFFDRKDIHFQNARRNYEKALEIDATLAPAYADLASAYHLSIGTALLDAVLRVDTIRMYCEKALSIDPQLPQALSLLGYCFFEKNEGEKFVDLQLKAIKANENYAQAYALLGDYYTFPARGEYIKGIRLLHKAIQLDPFSTWTTGYYFSLAIAYLNLNAFEEAEQWAWKVQESGGFSDWNLLVHLYIAQGKYDKAEALAIEWRAKSPAALRYLTEIEINHHKNYKKAIEMYKEYEKFRPSDFNYRQRFGLAYWLDGQKEKGRELLLQALAEFEKVAERREDRDCYDQAGIMATLGNTQKALDILRDTNCHIWVGLDTYILIDPLFQNLWDNAEFKEIVRTRQAEKAAILEQVRAERKE